MSEDNHLLDAGDLLGIILTSGSEIARPGRLQISPHKSLVNQATLGGLDGHASNLSTGVSEDPFKTPADGRSFGVLGPAARTAAKKVPQAESTSTCGSGNRRLSMLIRGQKIASTALQRLSILRAAGGGPNSRRFLAGLSYEGKGFFCYATTTIHIEGRRRRSEIPPAFWRDELRGPFLRYKRPHWDSMHLNEQASYAGAGTCPPPAAAQDTPRSQDGRRQIARCSPRPPAHPGTTRRPTSRADPPRRS
jgi:hypothetical protein